MTILQAIGSCVGVAAFIGVFILDPMSTIKESWQMLTTWGHKPWNDWFVFKEFMSNCVYILFALIVNAFALYVVSTWF